MSDLRAAFSDLAVELEKHSNDHIRDNDPADRLGAAVEGVCADRINAILKRLAGGHVWTGCQHGGGPTEASSTEWVRYCKRCGIEDTCEDPLPPCEPSDLAALEAQFWEKAKAVAGGLKRIESIVEFGLEREIESPSNHQEFAREASEKLRQFRKDLKDADAVLALHAEIEKRKGRE